MRLQSASRCGDYPSLSNGNNHRRNRRGLDRSRRTFSLDEIHRATNRSLRPVLFFTGGGKQVDVASNEAAGLKVWLERFSRNLTSVDVDGQEVNDVVLGVESFFRVFAVVGIVVDAPQY